MDSESVPGSQVARAYGSWGHVSEWFQKIDVLGAVPQVQVLKVGVLSGFHPFSSG